MFGTLVELKLVKVENTGDTLHLILQNEKSIYNTQLFLIACFI